MGNVNVEHALTEADVIEHVLGATPIPLAVAGWGMLDLDITVTSGLAVSTESEVEVRSMTSPVSTGERTSASRSRTIS